MDPNDKPKGISFQLNPRARAVIEGLRRDTGVPNTEALTRILEWYASLDRKLRLAVLNGDPETRRELAALVAADLAENPSRDLTPAGVPSMKPEQRDAVHKAAAHARKAKPADESPKSNRKTG